MIESAGESGSFKFDSRLKKSDVVLNETREVEPLSEFQSNQVEVEHAAIPSKYSLSDAYVDPTNVVASTNQ